MDVLLTYPPFGAVTNPYISVPTLAAYLRTRGLKVSAVDANIRFYRSLLSPERLREAQRVAENRFTELNGKTHLRFKEMLEFVHLVYLLGQVRELPQDMEGFLDPDSPLGIAQRMQAIKTAFRLASCPYFPETIEFNESNNIATYISGFHRFSSAELLQSIEADTLLSGFFEELLPPILKATSPKVVGISVGFPDQTSAALRCARVVKRALPQTHVTLGGSFVTCHMRSVREKGLFEWIDSLVLDEGEIPLERLIAEVSSPAPDLSRVPGLVYLCDGEIRINPPPPLLDMESLPAPDYQVFSQEEYLLPVKFRPLLFRLSRGCYWARCAFCRTGLSVIHHHQQPSADYLFDRICTLVEETGCRIFNFTDDAASVEVLEELSHRIIRNKLDLTWTVNLRFDPKLTLERCLLFQQAGCSYVSMGIESYNDRLLRLMRKGITTSLIDRVLSNLYWANLSVSVYMIVGFPTETEQEALDSFARIQQFQEKGLIRNYMYHIFQILPYSDVADHPERYGIRHIASHEHLDFLPQIDEFQGEGMPRETARALETRFNAKMIRTMLPQVNLLQTCQEVPIGNTTYPLHFNPAEIASAVARVPEKKGSISQREWYEMGDRMVKPVARSQ